MWIQRLNLKMYEVMPLLICEMFTSIQGEGINIGTPTTFIRTSGCNLRCSWCDTTYAFDEGQEMSLEQILEEVESFRFTDVCITGGEPLLQPEVIRLLYTLLAKGHRISLETNGSLDISQVPSDERLLISMDVKCPSSLVRNALMTENLSYLKGTDQLKFTIANRSDYEFAKDFLKEKKVICPVVFQPVWGTDGGQLADWVCRDGLEVRVLTQLHKVFWGSKKRKI